MRVLAIETIGTTGTVAALEDQRLLADRMLDPERRSAQMLVPGIRELLDLVGWRPADIELVAVAEGPGSFTGLRIGVTTAKSLAYAMGCPAIGVHSLRAIAARAPAEVTRLSAALDAQRGEVFAADFVRSGDGSFTGEASMRVLTAQQWLAGLAANTWVSGPALAKWAAQLPADVRAVAAELWSPTAVEVGRLGQADLASGKPADVFALAPRYYRRTAAEEQWERKEQGGAAK